MPFGWPARKAEPRYRRCQGLCNVDRLESDLKFDPERCMWLCNECWGNLSTVGERNAVMRPKESR